MTGKYNTLLIRLRPETRALLDRASDEQRRSRASIIEQLISEALANRYNSTADRLNKLLAAR
jgi:predicted transcriptional regulator